jgi:hypothetical protein
MAPFTFPVNASTQCWGALLLAAMVTQGPADLVLISKNGNTTADAVPGGDPGFTVDDAEAYFGTPLGYLIVQFQTNDLTPAQNLANLHTIYDAAVAVGTQVYICTPHPVLAGTFTPTEVDDLIELRDMVLSDFGARAIDAWTFGVLPNGRDADPTYMIDDRLWNALGHQTFQPIVSTVTGLG